MRSGDVAAFEQLFRTYHAPLCGFVLRYVAERALAEELVQQLFADLWIDRARLDVRGSVRAYLYAAARNRALNARRRHAVERDWEADEAHDDVRSLHPRPETPDAIVEAADRQRDFDAAFDALPERCRLAMHLRWRDGLTYAEVAEVLGISVKGVENQLGRGLRALRDRLR